MCNSCLAPWNGPWKPKDRSWPSTIASARAFPICMCTLCRAAKRTACVASSGRARRLRARSICGRPRRPFKRPWSFLPNQPKSEVMLRLLLLILLAAGLHAADQERVVTSILPTLDYGGSCWSSVTLSNLGDRDVTVEIEAHRAGGGLIGLAGLDETVLHLN